MNNLPGDGSDQSTSAAAGRSGADKGNSDNVAGGQQEGMQQGQNGSKRKLKNPAKPASSQKRPRKTSSRKVSAKPVQDTQDDTDEEKSCVDEKGNLLPKFLMFSEKDISFRALAKAVFPEPFSRVVEIPNKKPTGFEQAQLYSILYEDIYPRLRDFGYDPDYIHDKRKINNILRGKKKASDGPEEDNNDDDDSGKQEASNGPKETSEKNPEESSEKNPWAKTFQAFDPRRTRSNTLLCGRCQHLGDHEDDFSMCKIALINCQEPKRDDGDRKFEAIIEVTQLFPHNQHCCTPNEQRGRCAMQPKNGGSGVVKMPMNSTTVLGTTYSELVAKIQNYDNPSNGLPPGKPAPNFITGYRLDDYMSASLPSTSPDEYGEELKPYEHRKAVLRIILWFSNTFDVTAEFWDIKKFFGKFIWSERTAEYPTTHGVPDPDKKFTHVSVRFGGHGRNTKGEYLAGGEEKQLVHGLQMSEFLEKDVDGVQTRCTQHKPLRNLFSVGTLVVPLKGERAFWFSTANETNQVVQVKLGEALWINGDVSYGTVTRMLQQPAQYAPTLNLHLESSHFKHELNKKGFCAHARIDPRHLGLMGSSTQLEIAEKTIWPYIKELLNSGNKEVIDEFDNVIGPCMKELDNKHPGKAASMVNRWYEESLKSGKKEVIDELDKLIGACMKLLEDKHPGKGASMLKRWCMEVLHIGNKEAIEEFDKVVAEFMKEIETNDPGEGASMLKRWYEFLGYSVHEMKNTATDGEQVPQQRRAAPKERK